MAGLSQVKAQELWAAQTLGTTAIGRFRIIYYNQEIPLGIAKVSK